MSSTFGRQMGTETCDLISLGHHADYFIQECLQFLLMVSISSSYSGIYNFSFISFISFSFSNYILRETVHVTFVKTICSFIGSEVLIAVVTNAAIFWQRSVRKPTFRRNEPSKKPECSRWLGLTTYGLHGAISHKMATIIICS
jgi:hypothetical protein